MAKIMPTVDGEFMALGRELNEEELRLLRESLLEEGCREPIVCWDVTGAPILDGHQRHAICQAEKVPFGVKLIDLPSRAAAVAWIARNQLGRRNSTEEEKSYLRGKLYQQQKQTVGRPRVTDKLGQSDLISAAEQIGQETGVTERTVRRDEEFMRAVDAIAEKSPTVAKAARDGVIPKTTVKRLADIPKARLKKLEKLEGAELRKAAAEVTKKPKPPEKEVGDDEKSAMAARAQVKVWHETIARWLGQSPSIDEYRNNWPSPKGDRVVKAATELYEALKAWQKAIR